MKNCILLTAVTDSEYEGTESFLLYDDNLYSFADASKIVADLEARAQEAEIIQKAFSTRRYQRGNKRNLTHPNESYFARMQYLDTVEPRPIEANWIPLPFIKQLNIT